MVLCLVYSSLRHNNPLNVYCIFKKFLRIFYCYNGRMIIGLWIGFDDWRGKPVEFQFHDTYIILSIGEIFLVLFLNLAFWTFLARQSANKFKRLSTNIIFLLVTGALIFISSLTIKFVGSVDQGWTIYPPLSTSPTNIPERRIITSGINTFLQGYEAFQLIVLAFVGIQVGRGIERRRHLPRS